MEGLRRIRHYFFAGLIVVIPLTITLYVFYQIFLWVDANLGRIVFKLTSYKIPGISFLFLGVFVLLTILIGMLTAHYIGRRLVSLLEGLVSMIPFVRGVYMTIKQVLEVFLVKEKSSFREVVLVEFPRKGIYSMGLVTSKGGKFVSCVDKDEFLTIFVPTAPNPTSGFVLLVPASEVIRIPITVDQALKFVVSAGVLASELLEEKKNALEYEEKRKLDSVDTSNTFGR